MAASDHGTKRPEFCLLAYPLRVLCVSRMKMVRTPMTLSSNRSLVVLVVLLLVTVAGVAAARELAGTSFAPAAPVYGPAENPAPIAPAVEGTSLPAADNSIPGAQTVAPFPATETAAPAPATVRPVPATALPHPTLRPGPATSAAPDTGVPVIAPEPGLPTPPPPPGGE